MNTHMNHFTVLVFMTVEMFTTSNPRLTTTYIIHEWIEHKPDLKPKIAYYIRTLLTQVHVCKMID